MLITPTLFSIIFYISISTSSTVIHNALLKAEENAVNNPSLAINRYHQYLSHLNNLPNSIQLRWHTAAIRAALNSAQFEFAEAVFKDMKLSYDKAGFNKQGFYFNLAGIWFRRKGFFVQAEQAYDCAFKTEDSISEQIKYLNNAAIAARYTNNSARSNKYLNQALTLLKKTPHQVLEASINNTLGMLALSQKDYLLAKKKFTRSLFLKEGKSRDSAQLISALNLLNTLLYLEDESLSIRVLITIERLIARSNNIDHRVYYHWLQFSLAKLQNKQIDITQQMLVKEFKLLAGSSYIALIKQRAEFLNITLPKHNLDIKKMQYSGPILHYLKSCDTNKIED
jgi:hypothetical protein